MLLLIYCWSFLTVKPVAICLCIHISFLQLFSQSSWHSKSHGSHFPFGTLSLFLMDILQRKSRKLRLIPVKDRWGFTDWKSSRETAPGEKIGAAFLNLSWRISSPSCFLCHGHTWQWKTNHSYRRYYNYSTNFTALSLAKGTSPCSKTIQSVNMVNIPGFEWRLTFFSVITMIRICGMIPFDFKLHISENPLTPRMPCCISHRPPVMLWIMWEI